MSTRPHVSFDIPMSFLEPLVHVSDIETDDPDSPTQKGYQRVAQERRYKAIADCFESSYEGNPRAIPSLSLNCRDKELSEDIQSQLLQAEPDWKKFTQLVGKQSLYCFDGQHRLGGLRLLLEERGVDRLVPCVIYLGMDLKQEVMEFDTQNQEAKKMPKSQAIFNRVAITDDPDSNDPDVRLRRLAYRLYKDCDAWAGLIGSDKLNRKMGQVLTLEGLRRSMGLFFTPNLIESYSDDDLFEMADDFFTKLKEACGENWGSHYCMLDGEPEVFDDGKKVRSRLHHLATLAGICHYGFTICNWPEPRQREAFANIAHVDWSENSEELAYPAGFAGLKQARGVFRDILGI